MFLVGLVVVVAETMGFGVVVRGQAKEVVGCGQGGICSGSWGLWVVVVARPRLFCSCHGACVLFLGHSGCSDGGFAALFLVGLVVVKKWVLVWWCLILLVGCG